MGDKPTLFSAPMVRALLAGAKTQTRRLIPQATQDAYDEYDDWCRSVSAGVPTSRQWEPDYYLERSRIQIGDRLWVRETWSHTGDGVWTIADARMMGRGGVVYRAESDPPGFGWFPSIFMPREFSRLTLTVTDVRVQRLQDISEEDAQAGHPGSRECTAAQRSRRSITLPTGVPFPEPPSAMLSAAGGRDA